MDVLDFGFYCHVLKKDANPPLTCFEIDLSFKP